MPEILPDDPDADLVPAAVDGDADAFDALVRRYQARIVGLARTLSGNSADAEDLAQEVFVRLHRSLDTFRGESLFRTWLYRIAVNVTRSHHARRARQQAVWSQPPGGEGQRFDPVDPSGDAESSLVRRDAIDRALRQLPEDQRLAVTLRDVHGLDYREIAGMTGAPIGTVESRIFRARRRLRQELAPLMGDE